MDPSLGRIFASLASTASQSSGESEELAAIGRAAVASLRDAFVDEHRPNEFDDLLSRVESGQGEAVSRLAEVIDNSRLGGLDRALLSLSAEAARAGFVPPPPANLGSSDSMAELEEAVVRERDRFTEDPESRLLAHELTMLLEDLTIRYRDLGRNEEALQAALETRAFAEVLAEIDPDYGFGISFDLLSDAYAKLGRFEEAAKVAEEGLEGRRHAWSLKELSGYYTSLGRHDAAVEKAEEAVAMEREKASAQHSLLPLLLEHLSTTYRSAGRSEEALPASQQAVAIHRPIADDGPVTGCERGRTLTALITLQDELGLGRSARDCEEAIAATEHCLALHRVMGSTDLDGLATLLAQRGTLAIISDDTSSATLLEVRQELESLAASVGEDHPAIIWLRSTEPI